MNKYFNEVSCLKMNVSSYVTTFPMKFDPFTIASIPFVHFCLCLFVCFFSFLFHLLFSLSLTLIIGIFYCLNYTLLLLHLLTAHLINLVSHLSLWSIIFMISMLIINIFYTSLLLHCIITQLEIYFTIV